MSAPKRVYIAGPYSNGDVTLNVRLAISVAHTLLDMGYVPYCPHLSHWMDLQHHRDYEDWMAYHLHWLPLCDVVLRLPGESPGADSEVARATELGIPVVYGIEELRRL